MENTIIELFEDLEYFLCSDSCDLNKICDVLRQITKYSKLESNRENLTSKHWCTLLEISRPCQGFVNKEIRSSEELHFVAELLRCCRISCIGCIFDEHTLNAKDLVDVVINIFQPLISQRSTLNDKEVVIIQLCLQVFGNVICQNQTSKLLVWDFLHKNDILLILLNDNCQKVKEYTMMVFYNCLTSELKEFLITTSAGQSIIKTLTDSLCSDFVDWGYLLIESLILHQNFMDLCYPALHIKNRLLVLDVMAEMLNNTENTKDKNNMEYNIKYVKNCFVKCVMDIVKTCDTNNDELRPVEILKFLNILCAVSSDKNYSQLLLSYKDLLEISINTLKSVHLLGKQSCNSFSSISKLKNSEDFAKDDIELHPSFGFKKNLIRLIGNMSCQCKRNQDLVRELDGIPLLLDCCNLDLRNPYIMQWCILAIRNLLENNQENQAVLANLSVSGELENCALLTELGLKIEFKENRPILTSLEKK